MDDYSWRIHVWGTINKLKTLVSYHSYVKIVGDKNVTSIRVIKKLNRRLLAHLKMKLHGTREEIKENFCIEPRKI